MTDQRQANWWLWILVLVALPLFCVCGLCTWGWVGISKPNGAHLAAIPLVETNEKVAKRLGVPVTASKTSLHGKTSDDGASADASFQVEGPEGSGTAYVSGHKRGESWEIISLKVEIPAAEGQEALTVVIK